MNQAPPPILPATHDLVKQAKQGNSRAFELLVARYRPRIFALSLHLTGRRCDADDVTQETFLRAYRNLSKFEGRSQFFTWLYRIALNQAFKVRRKRKRHETRIDDPRLSAALAVDAGGDPHRALELQQQYQDILIAFDALSPSLRQTVALVSLQGLTHQAAAEILETSEGTVAWRIHESRKQMRDTLKRLSLPMTRKRLQDRRSEQERSAPHELVKFFSEFVQTPMRPSES